MALVYIKQLFSKGDEYNFLKLDYSKSCCPCGLMQNQFYISEVKGYEIKRQ